MSMKSILSLMTVALFSAWLVACGGGSVSGSGGGGSSSNLVVKLDQSVNSAMFQTSPEYGNRMVATISDLLIRTAEAQVGGTVVYVLAPDGTVVASGPVNDAGEAFFDVPANTVGETYSVCLTPVFDALTCVTLTTPVTETDGVQVTVGQDGVTGELFIVSEGLGTQVEPTADNLDAFQDPKLAHKVIICHNANKNNPHTISVAKEAWPAHEAHGDTLGACPVAPTDTSTSGVEEDDGPGNSGKKGNKGNKGGKKS